MSKTIRCHGCQACQPEPDLSYGSFLGGDPRTFSPDPECSTEAERALHKQHCQEWETGQQPAVPVSGLEPLPEYRTKDGRTIPAGAIAFVEQAVYGLGVSVVEWPKPICGERFRVVRVAEEDAGRAFVGAIGPEASVSVGRDGERAGRQGA
jgi:hypothetical protein